MIQLLYPNNWLFDLANIFQFTEYRRIHMPTLLLYLIVRCQKHLRSDSLRDSMKLIRRVHNKVYSEDAYTFDRLILRLTYRSLVLFNDSLELRG